MPSQSVAVASLSPPYLCAAQVVRPAQGGMVTHVKTLISSLADVRSIVAAPAGVLAAMGRRDNPCDCAVVTNRIPGGAVFRQGRQIGDWARANDASLLHGHGIRWSPLVWRAARRARLPFVITLHNLLQPASALERAILRFLLGRADQLIAVSNAVAAGARSLLGGEARICVIPNGIDLSRFDAATLPTRQETRLRLGIPADAAVALCVARLSLEKGVADFLEAAERIVRGGRLPRARFLVAGEGPERAALAARIAAGGLQDRVLLLGARDDIPALMHAADVLCVPSRAEGQGIAAIEGMAAGLPVVATKVGGLPEVVVDGVTGALVPLERGVAGFAGAVEALLLDPERARAGGAAGRARAHSLFQAETMAAVTRGVYAEVAGR